MTSFDELMKEKQEEIYDLKISNKKLKEERDFFKEQAILWRNDYKNEYEENRKLKEDSLLGQATMEEAYNRIIQLEEENKKLKTIIESIMKKYNMKEIGMGDEIIMKRDE